MKVIDINEAETRISVLLASVEHDGETYVISRSGKPVGELRPSARRASVDPLKTHSILAGKISYNPVEAADETEWPEECR